MPMKNVQFTFSPAVVIEEVQGTLALAVMALESLYGPDRVVLDATYRLDPQTRTLDVDRANDVGATFALILLGFLRREFGPDAFRMRRVDVAPGATGGAQ
jgi:hypothetical protein